MSISLSQDSKAPPWLRPELPYVMGRFTLCRELGSGGMATVYLSKMRLGGGLDRLVALKTIHSHLAKEETDFLLLTVTLLEMFGCVPSPPGPMTKDEIKLKVASVENENVKDFLGQLVS